MAKSDVNGDSTNEVRLLSMCSSCTNARTGVQVAEGAQVRSAGSDSHQGAFISVWCPNVMVTAAQWNFEKFLIDKEGNVVQRWASTTTPQAIDDEVAKLVG